MTIPIATISNSQYSLRWRQPYVSESLNRKASINPRGIVQGFKPEVAGVNSQIRIAPDAKTGVSIAQLVGRSGQFTLTLRLTDTSIDLAPFLDVGDIDQDFALVIRPSYSIGSQTTVTWELVRPADFTDALLNDVMVVAFLRTDALDITNALQEVFVAGSAASRGVAQGWARQSLMVDYAKMGSPSGDDDGQILELLYDSSEADFDRFRAHIFAYGPQGEVSTATFDELLRDDVIDMMSLRSAGMMFPIAQDAGSGGYPDDDLFENGFVNIDEGPTAHGFPYGSVRVGGYNATWYDAPNAIGAGNPLVCSSPMINWYPCQPGDKFVVQIMVKGGGADTLYPASPNDPLIMQGSNQSGLGAFWGGPARQYQSKLGVTGTLQSEEVRPLVPGVASFVHDKNWTLYRDTFECPADYDDTPTAYQCARWFAPFWKFVFESEGHLLISGIKVWKIRNGRETGLYDEFRLSHTADSNPLGEAGRIPAQQTGRFSGAVILNPQGTKLLSATASAQDLWDSMPWAITSTAPNTWHELIGHSPNVAAFAGLPPTKTVASTFSNAASSVGAPAYKLELASVENTLKSLLDSTVHAHSTSAPGIWEQVFTGGMVFRIEPDMVLNAMSDVRLCLGDPPDPLGTWSYYDYPIAPRWCLREDGSIESNAHGIPQQGAQVQGSSEWGGKMRVYNTDIVQPMRGIIGQIVATQNYGTDNASSVAVPGNNRYHGYEAGRMEFVNSAHTQISVAADGMHAEWHLDLTDGAAMNSSISRPSESLPTPMARAVSVYTLAADNTIWTGNFGGTTVLELSHDEASAACEVADGQSAAFMVRMLGTSATPPLAWPFIAGGLAFRRGQTTETDGPAGFKGDIVASLYNSKSGALASHFAIDPQGAAHFYAYGDLDTLPVGAVGIETDPCRPGGDSFIATSDLEPAAAVFNWMPSASPIGTVSVQIDANGRLLRMPSSFTEFHYYTPDPQWSAPAVGDCLQLGADGVITASGAKSPAVVGLYMGVNEAMLGTQNSVTGDIALDYWETSQGPIDWGQFVYDPDDPPVLVRPAQGTWPELVPVASVGDNRVFDIDGNAVLAGFNVVDGGGDILIGDLLEMSATPGKLQKQADDTVHAYTVGKALEAVDFTGGAPSPTTGVYGILMCG